jgi:RND family efflux transporter MFP subunit
MGTPGLGTSAFFGFLVGIKIPPMFQAVTLQHLSAMIRQGIRSCFQRRAFALLLAPGSILATSCGKPDETPKQEVARPVRVLRVEPLEDGSPLAFPAVIRARKSIDLAFNVSGRVAELPVIEGMVVEEGGLLASLDGPDFLSRRDAARAAFELAQAEFDRYEKLANRGAVAAAEIDRRRAELQAARSELDLAEKALADTVLRAPFRGVVSQRIVSQFSNIQAKQPIVQFQALQPLDVVIDIPERLVIATRRNNDEAINAVVRFPTMDDLELPVTLREVGTNADPVTQTFRVVWSLDDTGEMIILPGMSATLVARRQANSGNGNDVFVLPPLSVVGSDSEEPFVWVFDEDSGSVGKRIVSVGGLREGGIEILSGLKTGDQVVVAGVSQLADGMSVRPMSSR